jgi:hypothetical protein
MPMRVDAIATRPPGSPTSPRDSASGRSQIVRAVHQLQDLAGKLGEDLPLIAGFDGDVSADRGRGFLGPRGDNHGLAAYFPELLRPLEPHFTRRLAHLLSPAEAGAPAIHRTQSFIAALFDAGAKVVLPEEAMPITGSDLLVDPEAAVLDGERKRRIDLLIRWKDRDRNLHCLAVEAKFNAPVRADALRAYAEFALQAVGARERRHLFLVVVSQHPAALLDDDWQQVTWFSVLRHWERRLATMAMDEDFLLFRSALWQRA